MKILKKIGEFLLVILLFLIGYNWWKKQKNNEKKIKEQQKKIKTNMQKGARRFGRPITIIAFIVIFVFSSLQAQYTNWNYEEGRLWNWYSKDSYIDYTQFYITNLILLQGTYTYSDCSFGTKLSYAVVGGGLVAIFFTLLFAIAYR